tara:strand:+ start:25808 stop:26929 length:1122 start_codon:yes stop_codon:yes gene_type:complete
VALISVLRAVMGDESWRRAALDYRSKFEDDFVWAVPGARVGAPPLRIAQAPSASAAEKRVGGAGRGRPKRQGERANPTASSSNQDSDDDAKDPIPATGFTVWDAGVLLGAYVSQPQVWHRLTGDVGPPKREKGKDDGDERILTNDSTDSTDSKANESHTGSTVVLELGAGTGVAGLALASTGFPTAVALTDLPGLCDFLKHNAVRNMQRTKTQQPAIPPTVQLAVAPVRWGVAQDVAELHPKFRKPTVLLGADLAYTENVTVIDNLAQSVDWLVGVGCTAVFASCREHRPESVDRLERLLIEKGFQIRYVQKSELAAGYGRLDDSCASDGIDDDSLNPSNPSDDASFRVVEFKRFSGLAMSDTQAEQLRKEKG